MTVPITYGDGQVAVLRGCRLLDGLLDAGIDHRHVCGGHGFCTSCRVEVLEGDAHLSPVSGLERERLGSAAGKLRLACQSRVLGSVKVRVPRASTHFSPFEGDEE